MIASLPMYHWPEVAHDHADYWQALRKAFEKRGISSPELLDQSAVGVEFWLSNDLLFSQTCGYPFATQLRDKVHLLGTPCYRVEGCDGPTYSSAIIVRKDAVYGNLKDALTGRVAVNSCSSLSGYRCFVPKIGDPLSAFDRSVVSGGHRNSALMVAAGEADCAAIDAVCWDFFKRFEPDAANNLRVLDWTPRFPTLPYITSGASNNVTVLREALEEVAGLFSTQQWAENLRLGSVEYVAAEKYDALAQL
ncbi:MAG: phosphate ABC transporter substrate-binding protein [Hyphomicrobiales bacterium]|nr:MAG: phosphate ABC transporter substrate-binding protein [Hyphomicrobiales bacterium]